jgi:type IV pilus assembly protein PilC
MKKFVYEARDRATDKIVKSTVQADSESGAAKLLISQGFVPISIREGSEASGILSRFSNKITLKDKVIFTRQLSTLLSAGLPLTQSLHTALSQTENKKLQSIIQNIVSSVEGGKPLAGSFAKYPDVFDKVYIALVEAGEASGTLDEALQRIAAQQEKDAATMSKIKGALTYPIIVLVVIFAVIGFMLVTVVPQVEKLYDDLNQDLPIATKIMVGAASFVTSSWWIILIAVGALVYFGINYMRTEAGIKMMDRFKLRAPIVKSMFQKLYMARLARTGQTLLSSGVSMLDALKITGSALNNVVIEKAVMRAAEKVKGGKALSVALEAEKEILPLVPQMIKIGEQSGKIDDMLGKAAQVFEDELDEQIRTLSTAIEPVLMVVLAIVAGGMVFAILTPIYGLVDGVNI